MSKFYHGKPCRNCGSIKRYLSSRSCVSCAKEVKLDPQVRRKYALRQKYGLSLEEYDTMMHKQNGACAICGSNGRLHVDHNHDTGKVRGLLCMDCNTGIGKLQDSADLLKKAAEYLTE